MVSKQQSDDYLASQTRLAVDDALSRAYRELVRRSRRGAVNEGILTEIQSRALEEAVHQIDMFVDGYLGSTDDFFAQIERAIREKFDWLHPCEDEGPTRVG